MSATRQTVGLPFISTGQPGIRDQRIVAQDQSADPIGPKRQSHPCMTVFLAPDKAADRLLCLQGAVETKRPHLKHGPIQFGQRPTAHFAPEDLPQTGPCQAEFRASIGLRLDNRNRGQVRPNGARVQAIARWQQTRLTARMPMLDQVCLRFR